MNRNLTSLIRFVLDECIPPAIRDSRWFMWPFFMLAYRGRNIRTAMNFKRLVHTMSTQEYADYYASLNSISRHRDTDLNAACIAAIRDLLQERRGARVLDAGCGKGFLARLVAQQYPELDMVSVDIVSPEQAVPGGFCRAALQALPFADGSFDVVLCTHTLEHCIALDQVLGELKRVCRGELVVVVPRQRPYYYTLDEHVQFFYHGDQLPRVVGLPHWACGELAGDWFYRGSESPLSQPAASPSRSLKPSR